jgi:hypothetical protein
VGAPAKLGVLLHEGDALDGEVLAEEVDLVADLGSYRVRHARWRLEHGPAYRAEFGRSDDHVVEVAVVVGEVPQLVGGERRPQEVQPVGAQCAGVAGWMFLLFRNTFSGSYLAFTSTRRRYVSSP